MQEIQEMRARSLGREDPLEEDMATYFSILAYKIPWTEEQPRCPSADKIESPEINPPTYGHLIFDKGKNL